MKFFERLSIFPSEKEGELVLAIVDAQGIARDTPVSPDITLKEAIQKGVEAIPKAERERLEAERRATEAEAERREAQREAEEAKAKATAEAARAEAAQTEKQKAETAKAEAEARAAEAERKAKELSRLIANTITGKDLTPEEEEEASSLLPPWQEGVSYDKGDVVGYKGKVEMALEDHIATLDNAPGMETGMWSSDVAGTPKEPTPYAPSKIYNKGDRIIWSGVVYQSNIDGNDKPPDQAPETWDLVSSD